MPTRRDVLRGLVLAGGCCLLPFGGRGWAIAAPEPVSRHLIVILLRGAVDGLSLVAPYTEANYYALRPAIALPPPGSADGLLVLDGQFGLHPALAPLLPYWQQGGLAFIQASGSPAETRSHFEAQDILETALLNSAMAQQGWLNGLAQMLPVTASPTRALSFGTVLPKIFQGRFNVATIPTGIRAGGKPEDAKLAAALSQLYGTDAQLGGLYQQAVASRSAVQQDLQQDAAMQQEQIVANGNAPNPDAFVGECRNAASVIRQDPSLQLLFMDVGGWDTHVNQGNAKGQLANRLQRLGEGLAALAQGLGPEYANTAVLVMSEFGRTVAQNGNSGTDHGHGNVAMLLGGAVRGGKVYGNWPGLGSNQLWEGRDLAVTTDFRSIIGAAVGGQFGLDPVDLRRLIPGYQAAAGLQNLIV